jgi:hypothetical protein
MRLSACVLSALSLGTGLAPAETVKLAAFRTWGVHPVNPVSIVAGPLTVTVAATACQSPAQNEGCRFDGVSNQAVVSVSRRGRASFRMTSDVQASFVRVAIVRLSARADQYGVVVDNSWGGSAGLAKVTIIVPDSQGFRAVPLTYHGRTELLGQTKILANGLWRDKRPGFVLIAPGFNFSGECNACTVGPPLLLGVRQGRSVDMSADPAARTLFARDLPSRRRICMSDVTERNGDCAAFVADAARLGRVRSAWRIMLNHYRPEPRGYPAALRRYLLNGGYISSTEACALPLN